MSDPAKAYHKAVKALADAEKVFRAAMDAVQQAREAQQWDSVPGLRKRCQEAESALDNALLAAQQAHRAYWKGRMVAEVPSLQAAALVLHRFTRIARAAGDSAQMARSTFDSFAFQAEDVDPCEDVPVDQPDSDLVRDWRDDWRGPRY